MTGPDTSSIAWIGRLARRQPVLDVVLDRLDDDDGVVDHDADASTRPNSVRLFRLKPTAAMTANVPTIATGTATSGMIADRQFWRNTQHHDGDQDDRVAQRLEHLVDRLADERRGVVADLVVDPRREVLAQLVHLRLDARRRVSRALASGSWKMARPTVGLPSNRLADVLVLGPELDAGRRP